MRDWDYSFGVAPSSISTDGWVLQTPVVPTKEMLERKIGLRRGSIFLVEIVDSALAIVTPGTIDVCIANDPGRPTGGRKNRAPVAHPRTMAMQASTIFTLSVHGR